MKLVQLPQQFGDLKVVVNPEHIAAVVPSSEDYYKTKVIMSSGHTYTVPLVFREVLQLLEEF